ncbi:MAG: ABC transporter permease [bacterium]
MMYPVKVLARLPLFKYLTTGVLVVFTGTIVLIFIADLAYINSASVKEVITSPAIRSAFFLSLITSLSATLIGLAVAVLAAYALSRFPFKGITVFDIIVDLLIVLPVLVIGVSLLVFFNMGSQLSNLSIWPFNWIGKIIVFFGGFFIYQKSGIVLAQFFCSVSFAIRAIKASFESIDPRTEQVAMTLGCTRAQAFWRVTLPLARQGVAAGAVLAWARSFGIFGAVAIVAGAVRGKTEVLPTSIYLEISIGRLEVALTISLVMVAVASLILILMRVFFGGNIFGTGGRP